MSEAAAGFFDHEGDSGLLLAFTVAKSWGGQYDDEAFVAGVQIGRIYQTLIGREPVRARDVIYRTLITQADLVAMHCGYSMATTRVHEQWAEVTFERVDDEPEISVRSVDE